MKTICMSLVLAACMAAPALAQHAPMFAASKVDAVRRLSPQQRQERRFLQDAAASLRLQGEASKLAMTRSTNTAVRQVAAALVNHVAAVQPEVLHLLHARGMALPMQSNEEGKLMKQLARLTGPKFDRVYIEDVALRLSQADAAQYERMLATTRDTQLQAWLERHVATVKYHATLAARALPGGAPRLARELKRESRFVDGPAKRGEGAPNAAPAPIPMAPPAPRPGAAPVV